ncbi:MAG: tetratricopeptide repeat protein [Acidobacteria bacterium]|nr:tetratricopeptide repeat protein [Acidobacteriota bacterium]
MVLFLATIAVFGQVRQFSFVNFDDPEYVVDNPHVRAGITPADVKWAFTSGNAANWFPLTRLSHMLDCQLFGLQSGLHHLTNVLLHAIATLLLFAFLNRATRARWPSALVAFIFALHPLHVESVAWVAERKDVLCTVFWFLTLWAYVRYAERLNVSNYLLALAAFSLGLMSKPMIVTLPFILLLLDVWPLRRLPPVASSSFGWNRIIWEKIPFFAASISAAAITYLVQQGAGAVKPLPLTLRLENALISYLVYIGKTLWPTRLAVFYPYPPDISAWQAALSGVALMAISAVVLRYFRTYPYLAVGWFWYIGTLLPVIGLVQVGAQARADRYMYVPMVGLTIMLAWGAADILRRWPRAKPTLVASAAVVCFCCVPLTYLQIGHWNTSESLFEHALEVTNGNYLAQHNMGSYLMNVPGRLSEAIAHLEAAVNIRPDSATAHTDLGNALSQIPGRLPEAIAEYRTALRILPGSPIPHYDLANTLSRVPAGLPEAISEYEAALRIKPDYPEARNALAMAHYNLGVALSKSGQLPDALTQFKAALRMKADYAEAHNDLGVVLSQIGGREPEAVAQFEQALRINPDYAEAHYNLGAALANTPGRLPEAIKQFEAAQRIRPDPQVQRILDRLRALQE